MVQVQQKILIAAARLVRPGGRLIYATCSLLPDENEKQIENFKNHIKAARETNLPIIIHTREADNKTIEILKKTTQEEGPFPGLIHCFSTDKKVADCALELGFYISISGIITFKNADNLRDIVKTIPLERLLIETDAPFLAPVPKRGRTNEY